MIFEAGTPTSRDASVGVYKPMPTRLLALTSAFSEFIESSSEIFVAFTSLLSWPLGVSSYDALFCVIRASILGLGGCRRESNAFSTINHLRKAFGQRKSPARIMCASKAASPVSVATTLRHVGGIRLI